jgi:hypothetical protein
MRALEPADQIVIPLPPNAESRIARAQHLFAVAQQGGLDNHLAEEAATLLEDHDPFVRGIAEWTLATRVNLENKGQRIRWPRANPPNWYVRWSNLSGDFLLTADYVRQGAVWGIHHQPDAMRRSMELILERAYRVIDEVASSDTSPAELEGLERLRDRVLAQQKTMAGLAEESPPALTAMRKLWLEARRTARAIVLSNPAANFERLVFIKRHGALFANITGSQYPWSHKPGGDVCVQDGMSPGAAQRDVIGDQLGPGHVHGMDLHWDGERVVMAYAQQPDWPPPWDTISGDFVFLLRGHQPPTHLYEINLDGTGLRQLTNDDYWSDFEPTYCADDSVVFASDRSGRSSECGKFSADHTVINLYRVFPHSGEVIRLNDNKDIDRYPHSLDNGQIAYTRWEYQERHFFETHAVWTMRPDGTMADAVFNQHLRAPYSLRDIRSVPGSEQLIAIASGHHTLAYGPVVLLDARRGINDSQSLEIVTPNVKPQEGPMSGHEILSGGPPDRGGVYQTPWALSPRCFLAAYSYSSSPTAHGFSIYLVDVHGNKELLTRDLIYSCSFPMPLLPRQRPPQLPDRGQKAADEPEPAVCYVDDVYESLDGIPRGTIKYLRISQHVGWPLDRHTGAMRYLPGNAWARQFGHWNWAPVRVLGEVPVEADGSAHFVVPADTAVYFQALDEDHMEVRRMRSHVTLQPGETRGCIGCHETRLRTPPAENRLTLATQHAPRVPEPPPWGADRLVGYESLVQPILDQHCVRCHDHVKPAGGLDFSGKRTTQGFVQSFVTMFGGRGDGERSGPPLLSIADRLSDASITQPLQFGSSRSRLIGVLRDDPLHRDEVELREDQWLTLVTWIDANAPYHDRFFNRRPADGGPPRRNITVKFD